MNIKVQMNPCFKEVDTSTKRYIVMKGSAGSGKSVDTAQHYIMRLMQDKGRNLVAMRKSDITNRDSTFAELTGAVYKMFGDKYGAYWRINKSPMSLIFKPNGNQIIFRGMNDDRQREKLKSITFPKGKLTDVWLEEATEFTQADLEYCIPHLYKLRAGKKLDLNNVYPEGDFYVIGNYPYNISSQIFFKVLEHRDRIPVCSGMIQKEVAERMASKPGCKAYGILSVLMQAFYDIEYLFTVHEFVFDPPPKVKSAVIRMRRNGVSSLGCDEPLFVRVVKTAFNQRRKMLRNSLQTLLGKDNPVFSETVFTKRPEQLSVADFVDLTNLVEKTMPKDSANANL